MSFYVFVVLFYVYCLFCVVLCIVCVYMCTVLLSPGGYPIAVKYIIVFHIISYHIIKLVQYCNHSSLCNSLVSSNRWHGDRVKFNVQLGITTRIIATNFWPMNHQWKRVAWLKKAKENSYLLYVTDFWIFLYQLSILLCKSCLC
jgi:hypothetical protein